MFLFFHSCTRYLKSTVGNIQLINSFRNIDYSSAKEKFERLFGFWMEYFIEATKQEFPGSRFPVSHVTLVQGHVTPWIGHTTLMGLVVATKVVF